MAASSKTWNEESITTELDRAGRHFYSIYQVAELLQVSHITVRRWIKEVKLVAICTSHGGRGSWRIARASLEEFLQERSCAN